MAALTVSLYSWTKLSDCWPCHITELYLIENSKQFYTTLVVIVFNNGDTLHDWRQDGITAFNIFMGNHVSEIKIIILNI